MKPTERVLEGQSNMGGERVTMSIDQSALAHIMSVLTDLYSDPELAVIREYATNALDSHIEAGVTRPIEITLPTPLSPFFRVKDYGVGLDAEGIREVYSQYGTSTKRNSNDVVGMLGLGCKSALTYSDQFTVTGYKNGRCIQVSVSRDEDGSGSMTIVADHATESEETGVEIIVPAKRHNAFEAKAHQFFRFWDRDTVLINGEHPKRIDGLWLNDKLLLTQDLSVSYVVMGNVAYPIPAEADPSPVGIGKWGGRQQTHRTVAFVPIGDVQFTPSREALQMTKLTKETLARIKKDVNALLRQSIQDQVSNAPNAAEALRIFKEGKMLGVTDGLKYKGREVMDAFKRDAVDPRVDPKAGFLVAGSDSYRRKTGERYLAVSVEAPYNRPTLWFENFDHNELSPTMREKLRAYYLQKGITGSETTRLVFVNSFTPDERFWLGGQTIHNWEDVAAIKITRKNATLDDGRPKGSYIGFVDGVWSDKIVADTIDTSRPILYARGNRWSISSEPEVRAGIVSVENFKGTLLSMPANRLDKFRRDFPTAKTFREYGQEVATAFVKNILPEDREAAKMQAIGPSITRLKALDATLVHDPDIVLAIAAAKRDVTKLLKKGTMYERWLGINPFADGKNPVDPTTKYPLLPFQITSSTKAHVYLYLNAAYAAGRSA